MFLVNPADPTRAKIEQDLSLRDCNPQWAHTRIVLVELYIRYNV